MRLFIASLSYDVAYNFAHNKLGLLKSDWKWLDKSGKNKETLVGCGEEILVIAVDMTGVIDPHLACYMDENKIRYRVGRT